MNTNLIVGIVVGAFAVVAHIVAWAVIMSRMSFQFGAATQAMKGLGDDVKRLTGELHEIGKDTRDQSSALSKLVGGMQHLHERVQRLEKNED